MFIKKSVKGQVTIFIIIAVLLIAAVALFFLLRSDVEDKVPVPTDFDEVNVDSFLKTCVEESVEDRIEILSLQGGSFSNPLSINYQFGEEDFYDISYLCYTSLEGVSCVPQQGSILRDMEVELEENLQGDIETCFDDLVLSIERKGYSVKESYEKAGFDLMSNQLVISLDSTLSWTKGNETSTQDEIEILLPTKLYNLGLIAHEIVDSEVRFNFFDENAYNLFYPQYYVEVENNAPNSTKIYTVEYRENGEKFRFAIKD